MAQGRMPGDSGRARSGDRAVRGAAAVAARQRLEVHLAISRRARLRRTFALLTSALSVLVLLTAASGWLLTGYVSSHVGRVNADTAGTPLSGPLNILLAGVDARSGLSKHERRVLHVGYATGRNSDTLMLVHITADHRRVEVVSLPRDSWVRIPGFGMNKINAAFGLGGPALMVRTVEDVTGLTVNDFVEVNFLGFVKIINALGGVNICLPFPVDDPYSGLHMAAGRHHVDGIVALEYARDRHSFALSDLTRITDQQQLISTVIAQADSAGTLTSPVRFASFLSAATAAVTVDKNLNVTALASLLRYVRPGAVSFTTVPLSDYNYITPTGESALLWNTSAAQALFARVRNDQPLVPAKPPGQGQSHSQDQPDGQVKTAAQFACR
jgi:LCP family protein required for cell wall assembly